jgi:hypothetical protein
MIFTRQQGSPMPKPLTLVLRQRRIDKKRFKELLDWYNFTRTIPGVEQKFHRYSVMKLNTTQAIALCCMMEVAIGVVSELGVYAYLVPFKKLLAIAADENSKHSDWVPHALEWAIAIGNGDFGHATVWAEKALSLGVPNGTV